jgi:hypothetical protein
MFVTSTTAPEVETFPFNLWESPVVTDDDKMLHQAGRQVINLLFTYPYCHVAYKHSNTLLNHL